AATASARPTTPAALLRSAGRPATASPRLTGAAGRCAAAARGAARARGALRTAVALSAEGVLASAAARTATRRLLRRGTARLAGLGRSLFPLRAACRGVGARGTRRCARRGAGLCRRVGTPVVAPGLVARLLPLRALPGVALAHLLVLIRDPTTVLGIVFPLLLVDVRLVEGFAVVDVHVVVLVAAAPSPSAIVVDVHLVTAPVAAARDRGA